MLNRKGWVDKRLNLHQANKCQMGKWMKSVIGQISAQRVNLNSYDSIHPTTI